MKALELAIIEACGMTENIGGHASAPGCRATIFHLQARVLASADFRTEKN